MLRSRGTDAVVVVERVTDGKTANAAYVTGPVGVRVLLEPLGGAASVGDRLTVR